ncbi:hypothetical protein AU467_24055 [Mesorhizobium loti]|uniref:Uncharacterized protein n=1 Tax=Rhizobium loti TaxID=381 RepID=A0A101KS38_RHILI|nr:hypothetical protein AU467_24055 [Mesorhizobium loti]
MEECRAWVLSELREVPQGDVTLRTERWFQVLVQGGEQLLHHEFYLGAASEDGLHLYADIVEFVRLEIGGKFATYIGIAASTALSVLHIAPIFWKAFRRWFEEHAVAVGIFYQDPPAGLEKVMQNSQRRLWFGQMHEDQPGVNEVEGVGGKRRVVKIGHQVGQVRQLRLFGQPRRLFNENLVAINSDDAEPVRQRGHDLRPKTLTTSNLQDAAVIRKSVSSQKIRKPIETQLRADCKTSSLGFRLPQLLQHVRA